MSHATLQPGPRPNRRGRPNDVAARPEPARAGAQPGAARPHARRWRSQRGQGLAEFALVLPLFLTVFLGIVEFAFTFNAVLAVNFATRNAALTAAEGGDATGTDCLVLRTIENDIDAPADRARVGEVDIYRSDRNGDMLGAATIYHRGGSTTCQYAGDVEVTVPYTLIADGYPVSERCNTLAGCGAGRTLDLVGVRITYTHIWVTPLRNFVGGNPGGLTFDRSNATRMEPVV